MNFADRLHKSIEKNNSFIVAGFDPRPDSIPVHFHELAAKNSKTNEEYIFKLLSEFHGFCLSHISEHIAAIKPNIAFFECYGIPGLRAFARLCSEAQDFALPVIVDGKRGDIGSTAKAYSQAFLGNSSIGDRKFSAFAADALTVNPFLGFDTLEPFLNDCIEFGKGIFVLVKTSNPGSAAIQNQKIESGLSISESIANWLADNSAQLIGESGYSSLGAVVGATYPEEAKQLREIMAKNIFLIPGLGSQGGTAEQAIAGFGADKKGAIVNVSRGLLASFSDTSLNKDLIAKELTDKLKDFNSSISSALQI